MCSRPVSPQFREEEHTQDTVSGRYPKNALQIPATMEDQARSYLDQLTENESAERVEASPMMPEGIYFGRLDDHDRGESIREPPQGFTTPPRHTRKQRGTPSRNDPPETSPLSHSPFPYLIDDDPFQDDFPGDEMIRGALPPMSPDGLFAANGKPTMSPRRDTLLVNPIPIYHNKSERSNYQGTTETIAPMAPEGDSYPSSPGRRSRSWWQKARLGRKLDDHSDAGTGNSTESDMQDGDMVIQILPAVYDVDTSPRRGTKCLTRWQYYIAGGVFLLIMIAAALGIVFLVRPDKSNPTSAASSEVTFSTPTRAPAASPTARPTIPNALEANLISLIQLSSPSTTFTDPASPQSQALAWIMTDPISTEASSVKRMLQRFALATLWFSTGGAEWDDEVNWLEQTNECDWGKDAFAISCDGSGHLNRLDLFATGLTGSLPAEIGLLTGLAALNLGDNMMTGTVPAELDRLTHLAFLMLQNNNLGGSISSDFSCSPAPSSARFFLIDCGKIDCECCESENGVPC